ncbi:hypothetical protein [uncultured Draconibacterium sp.]|uniref:hypothetical protein n=1 Tax=uncultured Draconibacterium sp. TaxID=1573823 RepID=UPI0032173042
MRKLSLNIILLIWAFAVFGQENPHGTELKFDCVVCHTTEGWKFVNTGKFNHNSTNFMLEGEHEVTNCAACHTSLVFSDASTSCISCHTDMHNTSVGMDCARCHDSKSWIVSNITELHQMGRFPLLGAHTTADCAACHTSASRLEFEPLGVDCIDCHRQDYLATTNPSHVQTGFSTNCIECHKMDAHEWSASGINHDFFPLTLGHDINECSACHSNNITEPLSPDCYSCHQNDYLNAVNPSHQNSGFATNCLECHTTNPDWKPAEFKTHDVLFFPIYSGKHNGEWNNCTDCHSQPENYSVFSCTDCHEHNKSSMDKEHDDVSGYSYNSSSCLACHPSGNGESAFNHNATSFPLKGAHVSTECSSCHGSGYAGTSTDCNHCHVTNFNQAANPNHVNAGISNDCASCHTENGWTPSNFDHTVTTGFELSGGHSGKQCVDCHQGTTSTATSDCFSCHQANYNEAKDHLALGFPTNCLQCHTVNSWEASEFNHNTTNFPLTGSHVATECAACHTNGYAGTPTLCNSCHITNFNEAQNPNHLAAGISNECETCHETSNWTPSKFDHTVTTGFELSGGHSGKQCVDCHQGTTSTATSDCFSCHQANYNEAKDHLALGFPTNCLQCHTVNSWEASEFNHNNTNFPLTGSHVATECAACHTNGYAGTPTLCNSCHINNFNEAQNPNHLAAGISNECETCHETTNWTPSKFDHTVSTGFELSGGHSGKQCVDCHQGSTSAASSDCFSCHQANYNEAKDHLALGFPTNCLQCHTVNSWEASEFNHNSTNFPLTGSHVATECAACHTNGYAGTPTLCSSCHINNFNEAQNPNHLAAGISNECETCHETTNWTPSKFDHTVTTGFELSGGHSGKQCVDCHQGSTSAATSECFSCHQANYNEAKDHLALGFPTNCLQCHTVNSWEASEFNHNTTAFPLTGAHTGTDCASCHSQGYAGTTTLCSECHQTDYTSTSNPNHLSIGISGQCNDCHTTNPGWAPASFPDHNSYYALNGAHATISNDCYLCHSGNYTSTANTCYACHTSDYNNTSNPNHAASKFSSDCLSCHSESAWIPSTFDHDNQYFPIYSGKHNGQWNSCTDCHTQPDNYSVFSCLTCHEHNQTDMNAKHREVSGYVYDSASCLACHPTGRDDD